jgi:Ca2+-binding EF-hand superfamily protein
MGYVSRAGCGIFRLPGHGTVLFVSPVYRGITIMRFTTWMLLLGICLACITPAVAADGKKPKKSPEERFKMADKDGDGKLSQEEFIGKRSGEKKAMAEKQFARRDKDGDKFLSLEEFKAMPKKKK